MSELTETRWQDTKSALLEGLSGNRKSVMEATLENTKKYLTHYFYILHNMQQILVFV